MGVEKMQIKLPDHDVARSLIIGGWMLFPKPEDHDLRTLYRSAVKHVRIMRDLKRAGQPIDPARRKYKWAKSGDDMLSVEQNPPTTDKNEAGLVLIASPKEVVEFFDDYEKFLRDAGIDLRFRKGIASGLVLLGCCVFQNTSKRRYGNGKGGAEKAVAKMIDLKPSSIRGYFKEFAGSAHLWASCLLQILSSNNLSTGAEIFNGMERRIALDFMVDADIDAMLAVSKSALDFGREEVNTGISLLDGANSVEFDWPANTLELIEAIPEMLVATFGKIRPESKLDR